MTGKFLNIDVYFKIIMFFIVSEYGQTGDTCGRNASHTKEVLKKNQFLDMTAANSAFCEYNVCFKHT